MFDRDDRLRHDLVTEPWAYLVLPVAVPAVRNVNRRVVRVLILISISLPTSCVMPSIGSENRSSGTLWPVGTPEHTYVLSIRFDAPKGAC